MDDRLTATPGRLQNALVFGKRKKPRKIPVDRHQITLAGWVSARGVGLHTGRRCTVALGPGPAGSGVVFERLDLPGRPRIEAHLRRVVDTDARTVLGKGAARVSTVEHLLAALYGLEVDNARVKISDEELPAFDGSALVWVRLIRKAGLRRQRAGRRFRRPRKPVRAVEGGRSLALTPASGLEIECRLDMEKVPGGLGKLNYLLRPDTFVREIAPARTYILLEQVGELRRRGLARGGSLRNALVIFGERVLNPGGLRFPDEPLRHKILDLVGDLALYGRRLEGRLCARRSGHRLHIEFLRRL